MNFMEALAAKFTLGLMEQTRDELVGYLEKLKEQVAEADELCKFNKGKLTDIINKVIELEKESVEEFKKEIIK